MQLHTGGKDMGKQKASFYLKLNKNNKRELDQKTRQKGQKQSIATKIAKQSENQKYKVQIKKQSAKPKSKNTYHGELGTDRGKQWPGKDKRESKDLKHRH